MPPPLPRCSRWAYSSLKITHPCQPSPIPLSCRPAHRPFRDLLGVHSRCGLHTRAVTVFRDRYPGASDISSPPCLPRLLPAGAVAGWALHPLEKRRLVTAHVERGHSPRHIGWRGCADTGSSRRRPGTGRFDPQETFVPRQRVVGPARKRSFAPDRRPCLRQDHVSSSSSALASFRSAVSKPSVNQP